MHKVVCPHCKAHRILTSKIPRDVIVVMPCPACHEWVVLFLNRVLAVSRRILKHGTFEERKMHIASVIAQFFEQDAEVEAGDDDDDAPTGLDGLAQLRNSLRFQGGGFGRDVPEQTQPPITQEELDRFIKIDLRRMDDPEYFKKNLG